MSKSLKLSAFLLLFTLGSITDAFSHTLVNYAYRDVSGRADCDARARFALNRQGYKLSYASSVHFVGKKDGDIVVTISCDVADRSRVAFIVINGPPEKKLLKNELTLVVSNFDIAQ